MNYDKKAITEHKKSTIKSLVGLIDAISDVPLDNDNQSGSFTLDDGTEVMLDFKISQGLSTTRITLGSRDVKYTVTEEKPIEILGE